MKLRTWLIIQPGCGVTYEWAALGDIYPRDLRSFETQFKFESAVPIQFKRDGPI